MHELRFMRRVLALPLLIYPFEFCHVPCTNSYVTAVDSQYVSSTHLKQTHFFNSFKTLRQNTMFSSFGGRPSSWILTTWSSRRMDMELRLPLACHVSREKILFGVVLEIPAEYHNTKSCVTLRYALLILPTSRW